MKKESKIFKKLIENSKKILIVTHKGPDPDAFCSSLIMKKYLDMYYPNKEVIFKAKQRPTDNYPHMNEITLVEEITVQDEDLIIVCDMNTLQNSLDTLDNTDGKTVIYVDHHETQPKGASLVINEGLGSATEQVISLWKDLLNRRFKYTKEIAELGQIGIVADTGRFLYKTTKPITHRIMAELKEVKYVDLEDLVYRNSKFPSESITSLVKFLNNLQIKKDLCYFYLTDKDLKDLESEDPTFVKSASELIKNSYVRYIQGTHWGFVLRPNFDEPNLWHASFRSTQGYQEVDKIAEELGGGGHKLAAAAKFEANNSEDALKKVLDAIESITHQN